MMDHKDLVISALVKALEHDWPPEAIITDIIDSTVEVLGAQPATQAEIDACYTFFEETTIESYLRAVEALRSADAQSPESDTAAASSPTEANGGHE